jgi:hypothetical protein
MYLPVNQAQTTNCSTIQNCSSQEFRWICSTILDLCFPSPITGVEKWELLSVGSRSCLSAFPFSPSFPRPLPVSRLQSVLCFAHFPSLSVPRCRAGAQRPAPRPETRWPRECLSAYILGIFPKGLPAVQKETLGDFDDFVGMCGVINFRISIEHTARRIRPANVLCAATPTHNHCNIRHANTS